MTVVSDVLSDRPRVWSRLWLTIAENGSPAWRMRFSRTRSNTTIVSWTEKPMTVSMAVTNSASICRPKNVPPMAKTPMTTTTSWSRAAMAVMPIRKSLNRNVIQPRMPSEPTMMQQQRLLGELAADDRADVCLLADLVDRPELVLEREAQVGQSTLGRQPDGRRRATMDEDSGSGDAPAARPMRSGWATPTVSRDGSAEPLGDGLALGEPLGDGLAGGLLGQADLLGPDEDVLPIAGGRDGRPIPWRPCSAMHLVDLGRLTACPSSKWTSQTVPPVKSIENLSPAWPPLNGVSRMKMIPGIMISRLKSVEPAALADDVKHWLLGLAPRAIGRAARRS